MVLVPVVITLCLLPTKDKLWWQVGGKMDIRPQDLPPPSTYLHTPIGVSQLWTISPVFSFSL